MLGSNCDGFIMYEVGEVYDKTTVSIGSPRRRAREVSRVRPVSPAPDDSTTAAPSTRGRGQERVQIGDEASMRGRGCGVVCEATPRNCRELRREPAPVDIPGRVGAGVG